ncbi:hypothetical protein [Streptomyces sp. NPDC093105]|uniref:hypothetical protein n=1 Tax=Streptomyces sp. NPDC093105 TaxID=3366029 RepID=UPI00382B999E
MLRRLMGGGGLPGQLTVRNTGAAPLTAWQVAWEYPAGGSTSFGFNASWTCGNPSPATLTCS